MADVRAMLRAERAARAPAKATQYPQIASGKKRKADDQAPDNEDIHKRAKTFSLEHPTDEEPFQEENEDYSTLQVQPEETEVQPNIKSISTKSADPINEDEWAAFERDVATPPASPPRLNALTALRSDATISAAPMTATELAERRKDDLKQERVRREEDEEAEKEEAENRLAEEFEEMDALEERVRKLKEMREKLRQTQAADINMDAATREEPPPNADPETEDDSDYDEDLDDDWGLRR
jgi:hypothetical protein